MIRNRPRLFFAAASAAALASMALADQLGQAEAPLLAAPVAQIQAQIQASNATAGLRVGDQLDRARLHQVTRPGLYGMSQPPTGSRYGILDGNLIRYDPGSAQILSVIRQVDQILD